ncbi:hypothetical protein HDU98_002045, partial [Podochytrium sp. JEL0797]
MTFDRSIPPDVVGNICDHLPPIYTIRYRLLSRSVNIVLTQGSRHLRAFESQCYSKFDEKTKHSSINVAHWFCCWPAEYQETAARICGLQRTPNISHSGLCPFMKIPHIGFVSLPASLRFAFHLTHLSVTKTHLRSLPEELGELSRLKSLNFNDNQIAGEIPAEFERFHNLVKLNLSGNAFTGPVLATLSGFRQLVVLDLSNNQFSGTLFPSENNYTAGFNRLKHMKLQHNRLTGPIPDCLGVRAVKLEELDLSCNSFEGPIPPSLGNNAVLKNLKKLLLQGNSLTGEIPRELAQLERLRELSVRHNKMEGVVPLELLDNGLLKLNVKRNKRLKLDGLASATAT